LIFGKERPLDRKYSEAVFAFIEAHEADILAHPDRIARWLQESKEVAPYLFVSNGLILLREDDVYCYFICTFDQIA
jgi:hypothetical protein